MPKKTKQEVEAEISALKKLVPVGPFRGKTETTISLQIETLEHGFDDTSEEWSELSEENQFAAQDALNWKNGDMLDAPSTTFVGLVA